MHTSRLATGLFVLTLLASGPVLGHVDSRFLTDECGSCHVGHGMSGEPMLGKAGEEHCYQCHGSDSERHRMVQEGRLLEGAVLHDIEREFDKVYRHPVGERVGHDPAEQLPRLGLGSPAHAECVDCHSPHQRIDVLDAGMREVPGFTIEGQVVERAAREYEVCLKCHSDESFLQTDNVPLNEAFHVGARSQHPVTRPSSGLVMPSLIARAAASSTMKCSDCHTNDDVQGPRGPHGSRHPFLLSGNYETGSEVVESPFAYEFCYSCHDRGSILDGDSFPLHELHIVGNLATGNLGTSCYTCHASHGSMDAPHLLHFSASRIRPDDTTRQIRFVDLGDRSGECYLSCHGYNHSGARY
jgi:predicted CXXCH cytochrome family protein